MKNLVVAIYSHPELFPPTLNAITLLSEKYDNIYVVCRNDFAENRWHFPPNVKIIYTTSPYPVYQIENVGKFKKIDFFITYTRILNKIIRQYKPTTVLVYDYIPLFCTYLLRKIFTKNFQLWYHNHDTPPSLKQLSISSITYWAAKLHNKAFKKVDIFSLPSKERIEFFPTKNWQGEFFFIPNISSKYFYNQSIEVTKLSESQEIKIFFQGSVGPHHGIEEMIPLLNKSTFNISLTLIGKVRESYVTELGNIASKFNVSERLHFIPMTPYSQLQKLTKEYHIGIAIHKPYNISFATAAMASNKIFEYIAMGIPVILHDTPHYREYLGDKKWAFFWNLQESTFEPMIEAIVSNYQEISIAARKDFEEKYNYEANFPAEIYNSIL